MALFSAAAVSGPTTPSAERPLSCWNAVTAASVAGPKVPSAEPGSYPAVTRDCLKLADQPGVALAEPELRPLGQREGRGAGRRGRRRGRGVRRLLRRRLRVAVGVVVVVDGVVVAGVVVAGVVSWPAG